MSINNSKRTYLSTTFLNFACILPLGCNAFYIICHRASMNKFVMQKIAPHLWEKLSEGGEIEQCGWLEDKFGVSWQIVPNALAEMVQDKDVEKSERVIKAMLQMKKIDIQGLRKAYAEG